MKKLQPVLPDEWETVENSSGLLAEGKEREERISGILFKNVFAEEEDFSCLVVSSVKFVNCRFLNCSFEKAEWKDVLFESCDLSGCNMDEIYLERVEIVSCKGVGTRFAGSSLHYVTIRECNLDYANFDASRLEYVSVRQTELNSSNISQCRCKSVQWENVRLVNASFFKTSLRGMDFSDSTITGLVLSDDNAELKGAIVDVYQAVELAKRLGIRIRDTTTL